MMNEAHDTRGARRRRAEFFPLNDLPNDVLVSVFAAAEDPTWVRHTFPLVCKDWAALYSSKSASPLHETLEVDFEKEVKRALAKKGGTGDKSGRRWAPGDPVVHASRIISWAEGRAGSVRKLYFKTWGCDKALEDFSSEELGALIAVVAPSLTEIRIRFLFDEQYEEQFWKSLRDFVVPAGRLRSLRVKGIASALLESDVAPLAQLAGSLEELALQTDFWDDDVMTSYFDIDGEGDTGLSRFPESLCGLTELRRLELHGHRNIPAIPAAISSLKKLEELEITDCHLSSLPKELGELSALTRLDLSSNYDLVGRRPRGWYMHEYERYGYYFDYDESWEDPPSERPPPRDETFPAELGNMKSLRELNLSGCSIYAVPSFVGELESLEVLDLYCCNELQFERPLDFLLEGCPRLRKVIMIKDVDGGRWNPESRARLRNFQRKLLERNPNAKFR